MIALAKTDADGEVQTGNEKVRTKYDRMFERKNQTILSDHYLNMTGNKVNSDGESEDEDFMTVKRKDHELKKKNSRI